MLDGNYKNLKVSGSFEDMLSEMTNSIVLTEELKVAGKDVAAKINEDTYADSRHRDILESFRENAPREDRYNQTMFQLFETFVLNCK